MIEAAATTAEVSALLVLVAGLAADFFGGILADVTGGIGAIGTANPASSASDISSSFSGLVAIKGTGEPVDTSGTVSNISAAAGDCCNDRPEVSATGAEGAVGVSLTSSSCGASSSVKPPVVGASLPSLLCSAFCNALISRLIARDRELGFWQILFVGLQLSTFQTWVRNGSRT